MSIGSLKTTIVVKSQRALSALRDKINQMAAKWSKSLTMKTKKNKGNHFQMEPSFTLELSTPIKGDKKHRDGAFFRHFRSS